MFMFTCCTKGARSKRYRRKTRFAESSTGSRDDTSPETIGEARHTVKAQKISERIVGRIFRKNKSFLL